jgi:transposase InsO family protein
MILRLAHSPQNLPANGHCDGYRRPDNTAYRSRATAAFRQQRKHQEFDSSHSSDIGHKRAKETRLSAQAISLVPCLTPVASPQSNGMSEAFIKTLKRDYIRISPLPDVDAALRQIDG